jgi:hypothetical protein
MTLLLLSYITFGIFLFDAVHSTLGFAIAASLGLGFAVLMMNPLQGFRRMLMRWFKSDTVAFCFLVGAAAFASILLNWFKIFMPIIMILSAEILARLDIQTAEFNPLQACGILTAIAWLGLGLGWYIAQWV